MEINYETIIKYLVKEKTINKFASNKHILIYSNLFPKTFADLLQNKFYRYGCSQLNEKKENISFFMSLFTLLNKDFITYDLVEENAYYNEFLRDILDSKKNENNVLLIQNISNILNINLLIFDFKTEEIFTVYPDESLNPWKPTFLLANYDEEWEPIIYDINSKRHFSYNDQYIKKIYSTYKLTYWNNEILNKEYEIVDNIKEIVEAIKKEHTKVVVNTEIIDRKKYEKMTKEELMKIIVSKEIKNINSKTLKKDIIDAIIESFESD